MSSRRPTSRGSTRYPLPYRVTVATPTTIYYRETEWGTAAGLSVVLLIVGIVIGRLITRRR